MKHKFLKKKVIINLQIQLRGGKINLNLKMIEISPKLKYHLNLKMNEILSKPKMSKITLKTKN